MLHFHNNSKHNLHKYTIQEQQNVDLPQPHTAQSVTGSVRGVGPTALQ